MNDQNNNQKGDLDAKKAISPPSSCAGSSDEEELVQSWMEMLPGSEFRAGTSVKFGEGR